MRMRVCVCVRTHTCAVEATFPVVTIPGSGIKLVFRPQLCHLIGAGP